MNSLCRPYQQEDATSIQSPPIERPKADGVLVEAGHERPLVLLVDDDRHLLDLMKIYFRAFDADLLTATGGREALFLAADTRPDIIITDYSMPNGNADYLLTQLRQQSSLSHTPVIVLTGWSFEGRKDLAHERDMTGRQEAKAYLQKPIEFEQLVAEVRQHCDMRPACHPTSM